MKTLHLLRHAKSSWKDTALADHERPLSKRGRETAKTLGRYLRREKIKPDLVVCSTAVRATETLAPIRKKTKLRQVVMEARIYEAPQQKLWKRIRSLPKNAKSVLLIGHNPALQELALPIGPDVFHGYSRRNVATRTSRYAGEDGSSGSTGVTP